MRSFTWLTPAAASAIAVLRCDCGPRLLRRWPEVGRVALVAVRDANDAVVDEALCLRLSNTEAELHVHGGPGMRAAVSAACTALGWQEKQVDNSDPWTALAQAPAPAAVAWLLQKNDQPPPFATEFLRRQPLVLITGPANAGKSTLLNTCCGHRRALVSDQAGTTRDLVVAVVDHAGWRLRLIDSAGLRATDDALEAAGQDLVRQARARADIVVYLHPADAGAVVPAQPDDVVVWGKADLGVPAGVLAWSDRLGDLAQRRGTILNTILAQLGLRDPAVVHAASLL